MRISKISKITIKTIRTIISFLFIFRYRKGKKIIISYVLAKQTQQPKTVKTLYLHTGQYSNFRLKQK